MALLLAALPIALSIYTLREQRKKQQAEVEISLYESAMRLVQSLRESLGAQDTKISTLMQRVSNLETEVLTLHRTNDKLRLVMDEWRRGIRILMEQISNANLKPAWKPSKSDEDDIE